MTLLAQAVFAFGVLVMTFGLFVQTRAWRRRRRTWCVIERPEAQWGKDYQGQSRVDRYTGLLEVCVDRRVAPKMMRVGVCDFDDDDAHADLALKAERRAAHLNSVRNET